MRLINRIYNCGWNTKKCGVTSLFRVVANKNFYSMIIILFVYTTNTYAQVEKHYLRQGNKNYNDKNYEEAQINYRKALNEDGNSYIANFNLGDALYQQKDFNGAAQKFEVAASAAKNKTEKAKALHNMGNAFLKADRLTQSIDAYKQALRNNPDDKETKYNLSYALKKQKEQENQQKQNKANDKDKQKQQNKQDQKDQTDKQKNKDQQDKDKQDQNKSDKEKDKNDNQKDEGQDEPKDEKEGNEKQQPQQGKISDAEAERILNAIKSEEQKVQQRIYQRNKDQQKNSKAKGKQW